METCPVCFSSAELKYKDHEGYQTGKFYDIYHCSACYTAYASPLKVDQGVYNHIYNQIGQVPGYDRYLKYADQVLLEDEPLNYLSQSEDMYWAIQQYLLKQKGKQLKILEVGCGFGYLTYALHKAGFDVLGIDISQVAIDNAIKRYGSLYKCIDLKKHALELQDEKYDLVIFTEVIEHIENVQEFMSAAKSSIKSNGKLLLTTPNRTAYPKQILWETEPPPIHLYWFSEKSIMHLAKNLKMRASFLDFSKFYKEENQASKTRARLPCSMRVYQPSRYARLDEKGIPLKNENLIHSISKPIPSSPFREMIKRSLNYAGLLKPITFLKMKRRLWSDERKQLKFFKAYSKKGLTLCAIIENEV